MRRATCSCIVPLCGSVGIAGVIVEAGVYVLDPSAFLCEMGVEVRVSSLSEQPRKSRMCQWRICQK